MLNKYSDSDSDSDSISKKVCFKTMFLIMHVLLLCCTVYIKVLGKCTKNLIGHSRLAFNNHESNIDC